MPRVTLAKSIRLPGDRLRRVGEVVDVTDEVLGRFAPLGVFAVDAPATTPVEDKPQADAPTEDSGADDAPAVAAVKRPARTAPLDTWRAYAREQGIDPKGLTKAEIIAATK